MEILLAKSAGFCFGVQNAIEKAEKAAAEGERVFTYGPIIHNNQVVENLKLKGVNVIDNIVEVNKDYSVIVRSHGISKVEYEDLVGKGANIIDATCPYVLHIHKIVEEKCGLGYKIVIIGDPDHPEVKGINGWCNNSGIIINNDADIDNINSNEKLCIVSQTTFSEEKWYSIVSKIIKLSKEILIYNTICSATQLRQREALELSKKVDAMVVIGGSESSNSRKLYEICKNSCEKTMFIEREKELNLQELEGVNIVGITAGASTPDYIIKNVIDKIGSLTELKNEQKIVKENKGKMDKQNFSEEQEYFMTFKRINVGDVIEGKVISVTDKEVFIDIGYKSDGILPMEEVSNMPVNLKEKFKSGDLINIEVISMNDGEGNILLSRKEAVKEEFYKELNEAKEAGRTIEVVVKEVNKGGFGCQYGGVKAFMPLSLSGLYRGEEQNSYVGKKLEVSINDIKERRGTLELLVSRKEIVRKEKEERALKVFEKLEEGQTYKGTVRSIIDVGVFVDMGDVDVFIPVSEISWKRINKPKDVINENQTLEFIVIKVNKEALRVTGSIKRMSKEPWEEFLEKNSEEDVVEGKVVRFMEYGAFVELMDGVDGLLHISNISEKRIGKPQDVLKIDQKINVKIIKIDLENRKVNLSLKDVEEGE
ncbi:MAG: bifunctional 4-hydroxy-3-methylbut-2-enyl diphosphate reductase/30S ribosomal protein [Clostridiales bacterium]|jgi:4-hydroxy-3-methylbut-2-enyl diphosphate reductase|nr:bifunctional 4-hydroxy-3-methylbut-2-enyl diphosphate reductase/30S ribosomal protein [Clostridiales bacterium]